MVETVSPVETTANSAPSATDDTEPVEVIPNIYESKLYRAETESKIAQLRHNIAYLEFCLQHEINYLATL